MKTEMILKNGRFCQACPHDFGQMKVRVIIGDIMANDPLVVSVPTSFFAHTHHYVHSFPTRRSSDLSTLLPASEWTFFEICYSVFSACSAELRRVSKAKL